MPYEVLIKIFSVLYLTQYEVKYAILIVKREKAIQKPYLQANLLCFKLHSMRVSQKGKESDENSGGISKKE